MKKKTLRDISTSLLSNYYGNDTIFSLFTRFVQLLAASSLILLLYSYFTDSTRETFLFLYTFLALLLSLFLIKIKKFHTSILTTIAHLMFISLYSIYSGNGIHDMAVFLFPLFSLITSHLLQKKAFFIISLITLTGLILIGIIEYRGFLITKYSDNVSIMDIILLGIIGGTTVFSIYLSSSQLQSLLEYSLKNAENYRGIFDSVSEAIVINNCDTGKIIHVNNTMLNMYGYTKDEVVQLDMSTLYQENDTFTFQNALMTLKGNSEKKTDLYTLYGKRKNGSFFKIEVSLGLTNIDGFKRVITVIRDIEEKSRSEEKIQQSEKMIALGQLAGGIAHDFRNQLTGILGCAELLKSELIKGSQQEALNLIIQSACKSTELTQQLLYFSRKGDSTFRPVNVNEIITYTISILERSIDKRIFITSHLDKNLPLIVGDAGRIQNAFLNICINARDAMPGGGSLWIKTKVVYVNNDHGNRLIEQLPPGNYITISISDTGMGIPPELHQKIFEPYFTTKPVGKGTGIGLSAVYGTIREHGGSIEVISELNKGSTFVLYFPPAEKKNDTALLTGPILPDIVYARRQKAIVIDDDPVVRMTISKMLTKIGLDVIPFSNGIAAVDYYRNFHTAIDLIFLDMNMPLLSGPDTLDKLISINQNVKVFIISGFSDPEEIKGISDSGIKGYITKPLRIDNLIDAVKISAAVSETQQTDLKT